MTIDPTLAAALALGEGDLGALEDSLMRSAITRYGLTRFLGGTTDIAGALEGKFGPLAQRLADRIYDAVIQCSTDNDTPLTDANAINRIMQAAAGDFADELPNEPGEYGPGSLADADDPAGSDKAFGHDFETTTPQHAFMSAQKDHAVEASMRTAFAKATGQSPIQHDQDARYKPDTRDVSARNDPLGESFDAAFPRGDAEATVKRMLQQ